jgi:hypothetical protein
MSSSRQNLLRSLGAYACLLAVMAIYAPQGMIAWWAGTGACCKAEYCPIHAHRSSGASSAPDASEHDGMNCEHEAAGKAGMAACTMNCCHDTEKVLVAPAIFLPNAAAEPARIFVVARVAEAQPEIHEQLGSKPLSPPPRFLVAA